MPTIRARRGISFAEVLTAMTMIGIFASIAIPRLRHSPRQQVKETAQLLRADLELARARALATRSAARVTFAPLTRSWAGFLDDNRDGAFAESPAESEALRAAQGRVLPDGITYGRPAVPDLPTLAGSGAITLPGNRIDFDPRGLALPLGTHGVVYLQHAADPTAVAAVSITAGAGIRAWTWDGGTWR